MSKYSKSTTCDREPPINHKDYWSEYIPRVLKPIKKISLKKKRTYLNYTNKLIIEK